MTPAEKMAARISGAAPVFVSEAAPLEAPAFNPNDPLARIRAKQARHAAEGRTEMQREAEAKAKAKADEEAAAKNREAEAKAKAHDRK